MRVVLQGLIVSLVFFFSGICFAQTFVVAPNIYENAEAPGSSNTLIRNVGNPRTIQLIFDESQLTELVNHEINSIAYRLSNNLPGNYPQVTTTWSEYYIELGVSVDPSQSVSTFANNYIGTPTAVRTGALTVAPNSWTVGPPPNPSPWGVEIVFDTPFLYTGGSLAMLVTHPGSDNPSEGNSLLDAAGSSSPGNGTLYTAYTSQSFQGTTGGQTAFVPVIRFQGNPVSIPEPSTFAFLLLGVVALSMTRRNIR